MSTHDGGLFWQETSPDGRWAVLVEEDERVCYGYLYDRHAEEGANPISGDVWLYNLTPTPAVPEWTLPDARDRMPFLNAAEFVGDQGMLSGVQPEHLEVKWSEDTSGLVTADIYIRGSVHARLKQGWSPGWSALAIRESPIAMPFDKSRGR